METIDKKISAVFLVNFNEIPFGELSSQQFMKDLRSKFNFSMCGPIQDPNDKVVALQYLSGLFTSNKGSNHAIEKLIIEQRKIIISMDGSTIDIQDLYDGIRSFFMTIIGECDQKFLNPIITAFETEIITKMNLAPMSLFSKKVLEFSDAIVVKSNPNNSLPKLTSIGFVGSIDYIPLDISLSQKRISLSRKEFQFSLAPGSTWDESTYYSKAPLTTEMHLEILNSLENG